MGFVSVLSNLKQVVVNK